MFLARKLHLWHFKGVSISFLNSSLVIGVIFPWSSTSEITSGNKECNKHCITILEISFFEVNVHLTSKVSIHMFYLENYSVGDFNISGWLMTFGIKEHTLNHH
jgi:hypothetical protein